MERWTPKVKKDLCIEGMTLRMWTDKDGEYVLYTDFLTSLAEKEKIINDIGQSLNDRFKDIVKLSGKLAEAKEEIEGLRGRFEKILDNLNSDKDPESVDYDDMLDWTKKIIVETLKEKKCDHQGAYTLTDGWHCPKCGSCKETP